MVLAASTQHRFRTNVWCGTQLWQFACIAMWCSVPLTYHDLPSSLLVGRLGCSQWFFSRLQHAVSSILTRGFQCAAVNCLVVGLPLSTLTTSCFPSTSGTRTLPPFLSWPLGARQLLSCEPDSQGRLRCRSVPGAELHCRAGSPLLPAGCGSRSQAVPCEAREKSTASS